MKKKKDPLRFLSQTFEQRTKLTPASEAKPTDKTKKQKTETNTGALPKAMAARGHRVMAVAPRYACYEEGWETGVRLELDVFHSRHQVGFFHGFVNGVDVVFVDHPCFSDKIGRASCRERV